MKTKIFIHVGLHKTGSSALQEMLSENNKKLSNNGILYPNRMEDYPSHAELAWSINPIMPAWASLNNSIDKIIDYYRDLIGTTNHEKVILSSEDFSIFDYSKESLQKLKDIFRKKNEIKIVCYLRKPTSFIASLYRHAIYEGAYNMSIIDYIKNELDFYAIDYSERLKNWSYVFGRDNIILRPYDKNLVNNNILDDFLRAIDVNIDNLEHKIISNTGINPLLLDAFILANKIEDAGEKENARNALVTANNQLPNFDPLSHFFTENELSILTKVEDWIIEKLESRLERKFFL